MKEKVTKCTSTYPKGYEPDYINPVNYGSYRYGLGKLGKNPLVTICMNPSAASDACSDRTISRIINVSKELKLDGWIVFNTYPERATDAKELDEFDENVSKENIAIIREFLLSHDIKEVWGAWGNDNGNKTLVQGKEQLLAMLKEIHVKVFYFGSLTKANNPRHPIQRQETWIIANENKKYI